MLILSRKVDQSILLGDILITVIDIGRGRVRLAIAAPSDVQISRPDATKQAPRRHVHEVIHEAMAAGVPLHGIEQALDAAENEL